MYAQQCSDKLIGNCLRITVVSPQFYSTFEYVYDFDKMELKLVGSQGNDFVAKCLSLVMLFAKEWYDAAVFSTLVKDLCSVGTLIIKLQADNDFYSHIKELKRANKPLLSSSLRSIARLTPCHRDEITGEVHFKTNTCDNCLRSNFVYILLQVEVSKTGMGSSAALTTSLVGALLHALGVVDVGATSFHYARTVVHNLSQLAHCIAQGKIGSGFDVSAAVYGSQIYCRFDPSKFDLDKVVASGNNLFAAVTDSSRWTQTAEPFSLPRGFGLIMADVCGGSSSSSMARGVLAWKAKKSEEVDRIWTGLAAANVAIKDSTMALHYLSHTHENAYNTVIDYACARKIEVSSGSSINPPPDLGKIVGTASREAANEIWAALLDLKTKFGVARVLLREMGVRSGQDIEPLQQQVMHTI